MTATYRCPRCEQVLPLAAFNRSTRVGHQGYCRTCTATYYVEHKDAYAARDRARYLARKTARGTE